MHGHFIMSNEKKYDLEERTYQFAKDVRTFIKVLPKTISNIEDAKQLNRSSGSVGANYIEANEALGHKDFVMKVKISRKETKESIYWLRLINTGVNPQLDTQKEILITEARELLLIFSAIINKSNK